MTDEALTERQMEEMDGRAAPLSLVCEVEIDPAGGGV